MYGKEASNRKQEIDRQHHTIPNQRNIYPIFLSSAEKFMSFWGTKCYNKAIGKSEYGE